MLRAMLSEPARSWSLDELFEATGWSDQVHVAGAGAGLAEAGLVEVTEDRGQSVSLGDEGAKAATEGLLEARIWGWLSEQKAAERTMTALSAAFERHEAGPGVGLLKSLGIKIEDGESVSYTHLTLPTILLV